MSQNMEPAINWEPYKVEILSHFVEQNHTLDETMAHMRSTHGLNATARQFKRQFGGYKNLRAHEWIAVVEEVRNRAMRGVDSEVFLRGRPIDRERVKREIRRRGNVVQTEESRRVVISRSTRDRICIRTPRPQSPSPSVFSSTDILPVNTSTSLGSIFPDLNIEGDVNMGMDDNFGDLTPFSAQGPPSFAAFARISERVCNDLVEDMVLNSPTSMAISPSGVPLDLNGFSVDGNFDWVMTVNLPWFQLQQKLELQELGSRTNSSRMFSPHLGGCAQLSDYDSQSQFGSVFDLAVTERHHLLGSLLDCNIKGPVSDLVPSFTSFFSRVLPERFDGELAMRVQQFFDPSYKYPLQRCFELAAFFVSNNKPTKGKIENFLNWVINNKHIPQLESFLRLDTATTRSFSQRILEAAASMKNTDLLRSLLLLGADFKPFLQDVIRTTDNDFIELLLSRVDPECLSGDSGGSLLLHICGGTDNVRAASILVENGANFNFNSYSFEKWRTTGTPLYRAVSRRQPKMVRFLLDKGADVNARCSDSARPTALAVSVGWNHNIEIVTLLLEHGADLRFQCMGQDFLEYVSLNKKDVYRLIREKRGAKETFVTVGDILDAASKGSRYLSDYLSRHKDKISQEQLEKTLCESINRNDYPKTTLNLLDWGVDSNAPTLDEPPLLTAAICEHKKAISATQILLDAGADVNVPDLLCCVIIEGNFELLCELLDAGIDLDQFGPEALEKAVEMEQVETVALLMDRCTPVNAIGANFSPLQMAAGCETLDLAEYLIGRGADVNTPAFKYEGRTALQHACSFGNLNMVKFLLANMADVNAPPAASKGITALEGVLICSATAADKEELFQLLLDNGARVTLSNERFHNSIIHTIIKKGMTKILQIALKAGANANSMSRGSEARTPIQLAAELGQLDVVKALVKYGAIINAAPAYQYGRTALQAAATLSSSNMELLDYLVNNSAEVNAPAGICGGITALQGAAITGNIPVVQYLLGKGALVNSKPAMKKGRTAIEGAAEHGRLDTVQLLLNYGATGGVGVEEGFKNAIKLAEENRHTEIVKILTSAQLATDSELGPYAHLAR